jgi:hypothetical protein
MQTSSLQTPHARNGLNFNVSPTWKSATHHGLNLRYVPTGPWRYGCPALTHSNQVVSLFLFHGLLDYEQK